MKQYIIIGVLALVLIGLIVLTTFVSIKTIEIAGMSFPSIGVMQDKKNELDEETASLVNVKADFDLAKINLETAQKSYITARDAYNKITEEDIEYIKEATKEDHYYVEWLWIVLGEYALDNNLILRVIDPRKGSEESNLGTVQIQLQGRYQDVANFAFEVENDNELKFKLDNMSMTYAKDNKINATFDVLSMEVLF